MYPKIIHSLTRLIWYLVPMLVSSLALAQTVPSPRLGVNTTTPRHTLDVNGTVNVAADSAYRIDGTSVLQVQEVEAFGSTYKNLYVGPQSGQSNTTGFGNYFSGYQAGYNNTTGFGNYFSGYQAGYSNTTRYQNHFVGYQAGYNNTTGIDNYFSGNQAGYNNTTGFGNYFSGHRAGYTNTTGNENHFVGYQAGYSNTTGDHNHFSGIRAGFRNTTGNHNTFSGYLAGEDNTTGRRNIYIGSFADGNISGTLSNVIAIGYNAQATASNQAVIGNTSTTSIGGYQPWTNFSDGRFKREVQTDVPGLELISRLRPVTYRIDRAALAHFVGGEDNTPVESNLLEQRETGFIAQEVEAATQAIGYAFSGVLPPANDQDHYRLSYASFVVPLVKAMQEQQEQIKALQAEVARLKNENTRLSTENSTQRQELNQIKQLESRLEALENLLHLQTRNH